MTDDDKRLLDELRASTIGAKHVFKSKIVEHDGKKYEIRQPSIGLRSELRTLASNVEAGGLKFNMLAFLVHAVIKMTYVPGTDILVFGETDYEAILAQPTGGYMDSFSEVASELLNIEDKNNADGDESKED